MPPAPRYLYVLGRIIVRADVPRLKSEPGLKGCVRSETAVHIFSVVLLLLSGLVQAGKHAADSVRGSEPRGCA